MFRRRKPWQAPGEFPTSSIQRLPFQREHCEHKIYYTTRFEPRSVDQSGIFEYDLNTKENRALKLWKDVDYYPRWDFSLYSATHDQIFFLGGANVQKHHHRYELLVIYDLRTDELLKLQFPSMIGGNVRCCLSDHDRYLHIVGGTSNHHHIRYDVRQRSVQYMYSFYSLYPQMQSCGLLYAALTNQLLMFGGRSSAQRMAFDEFWCYDLNDPLSRLSMKDASWLLINGWIARTIYRSEYVLDFPLELNDVVLDFLGLENTIHCWQRREKWSMPKAVYQCGYVLYKQRIILTFGGRDDTNECIDDIFYLDIADAKSGWRESKVKCPKASTYSALLMDEARVHIVPFYVHHDHFVAEVADLLPKKLVQRIDNDIQAAAVVVEDDGNKVVIDTAASDGSFHLQYQQLVSLQSQHVRHKLIISVLIGVLMSCIGAILFVTAQPCYAGIIIMSAGASVMVVGAIYYARFSRPAIAEYLLSEK
mmetsp:Transcript_44700/g.74004  ORF Transcript_44700/g.74004 Transcript_44700/m.74004 type:complete len:477 (-) Transcript_44700:163-1593(-)|eukprot:CAMPEP_0202695642 /NCGR_PEP_ID=MMETSP1385-20130828/9193_1 /ASSEMBLY_ACC=CAM_ASM_000861 /TAXON_ID=933848 /ORGANISM="Elphidium margaritaceum" /LENGTH=476 /DNA_ID=CAMNT_0049351711 /DNA_START=53 /DNA_END=1483 /DNA_ORIENTATION=-